jgi:hypothetical protein
MSRVETFSLAQFEAALPHNKATGAAMCVNRGLDRGEYVFSLPVSDKVEITIRSSVKEDGVSAGVGEDSIRCWLSDPATGKPVSSKLSRWVTRVHGWDVRLTDQLRTLYALGRKIGPCPKCGATLALRKVSKEGANHGKLFFSCQCGHFAWAE